MYKSILLLLAICIAFLPLTACDATPVNDATISTISSTATGTSNSVTNTNYATANEIHLTDTEPAAITAGGTYSISGTLKNGQLSINTDQEVFIELAGVDITNSSGAAIQIENAKKVTLTLKKGTANTLTDGGASDYNSALFTNDTLVIEGEGNLTINGNQEHGIESDDDVIINGGIITISAVNDGINAKDNLTINGGTIEILSSVEGMESKGDMIINGGNITIASSDDGINAATDLAINDGNIYAKSTKADAIDSNGAINIKGGIVIAIGAGQPEGGIDCDRNILSITGGILVAAGGTNSSPSQTASTQHSVLLSGVAANTILHLEGTDGDVLTFQADVAFQSMVFSSPLLKADQTYTIYTSGSAMGGTQANGLYTGSTYSGGTKGDSFTTTAMVTTVGGNTGMGGGMGGMGGNRPNGNRGEMPMGEPPALPDSAVPNDIPNSTTPNDNQTAASAA